MSIVLQYQSTDSELARIKALAIRWGLAAKISISGFFPTRAFQKMQGKGDGTTGVDNDFAERGFERIGAWIMGRNMSGPIRGAWPD